MLFRSDVLLDLHHPGRRHARRMGVGMAAGRPVGMLVVVPAPMAVIVVMVVGMAVGGAVGMGMFVAVPMLMFMIVKGFALDPGFAVAASASAAHVYASERPPWGGMRPPARGSGRT